MIMELLAKFIGRRTNENVFGRIEVLIMLLEADTLNILRYYFT